LIADAKAFHQFHLETRCRRWLAQTSP
jgi:hypothetical protein